MRAVQGAVSYTHLDVYKRQVKFVPSQEYHLFRGGFQFGFESIVCHVLMMPFFEAPAQKPCEESHLFADGAVPHILFVTQEIHILVQAELIEVCLLYTSRCV